MGYLIFFLFLLQAIFDQICSLRERRLDMEELLFETKKTCDTVKKDLDAVVKKVKVVDGALKNARGDLEAFQVRIFLSFFFFLKKNYIMPPLGKIAKEQIARQLNFLRQNLTMKFKRMSQ